ncbi:MAG: translation initiation factor IF-2 [Alphaproteobacteria bacterium]|nr:translation initiation factor IF-2 [Alphaproteobacteria bacterium]
MTEVKKENKSKLSLSKTGKLQLKNNVDTSQIRQSFTHGRSKSVTVEVKKKRTFTPGVKPTVNKPTKRSTGDGGQDDSHLTSDERESRMKALAEAKKVAEERAVQESEQAAIEDKRRKQEEKDTVVDEVVTSEAAEVSVPEKAEEIAPEVEKDAKLAELKIKSKKQETVEKKAPAAKGAASKPVEKKFKKDSDRKKKETMDDNRKSNHSKHTKGRKGEQRRRSSKLTITNALSGGDGEGRTRSLAAQKRSRERDRLKQQQADALKQSTEKLVREVIVPEIITVGELANRMSERSANVVKILMNMGVMATINQAIDADTAELVIEEMGHKIKRVSEADVEEGLLGTEEVEGEALPRPPVVTVMGHVDHGKTSLLDALRNSEVADGEAGGITQHIGAYQISVREGDHKGKKITFIDTPGHEAFTEMRARGAKVTDIVVLVVAADDGIMPQTIEAIHHAKAADVPIIVAINKIDKEGADPMRARTELLNHEVVVEEMSGDVLSVEVSAKQKINLGGILDAIMLQTELLDLKAAKEGSSRGVVVEAAMEVGRGSVATVLVQKGTLNVGDIYVIGNEWGRVRSLHNEHRKSINSAIPGMPVEITGVQGTPGAGDDFIVVDTEVRAKEVSEYRRRKARQALQVKSIGKSSVEILFEKIKAGETKEVSLLIKADTQGSAEALVGMLEKISTEEVKVNVLHAAVGGINESDVTLAKASEALIVGFNVRANPQARQVAKRDAIDIRYYSIIYDVANDVKRLVEGMLSPELKENILGYAEVRETFNVTKVGTVAGCMITEGMVKRDAKIRLLRDDIVVYEGDIGQLKRFKDDAKEVREGYECGMSFAGYDDLKVGDYIECYEVEEIAVKLD